MSRDPRAVVEAKRDGRAVPADDLRAFVLAFARGEVPDYLAAAFLMAAFLNGLDETETGALLDAMIDSGGTLSLAGISRPTVDKHSTGGVADTVTLVFAPLAASLGLAVAKLSGRGLGHTGGTLDKLESIPGFRTDLDATRFERQVDEIGLAVAAQSHDLVPADGALYALRDATATVPFIPFIATSVMSKKLAVATDLILLDVKAGSGAFMKTVEDATRLARTCVDLAERRGRAVRAAVTDMSQPLGESVGNALDVIEAIEVLRGERRGRLRALAVDLVAAALDRLAPTDREDARARAEAALDDGSALEAFRRMITAQGGDPRVVDDARGVLPAAPVVVPITAPADGWLAGVDAEAVGRASAALGAGRVRKGDPVDPAVGVVLTAKLGDRLERGGRIGSVHARDDVAAAAAAEAVRATLAIGGAETAPPPLVHAWIPA
ncbi:MAG: thymidine phosphorylase [Actinomycetota bacterium]